MNGVNLVKRYRWADGPSAVVEVVDGAFGGGGWGVGCFGGAGSFPGAW